MNKVVLIGRMTKDAELAFTSGKGTAVAKFTLAVDNGFGDKKETSFIPIVVWGKGAESVANYTHKGSKVGIVGRINTRSYDAKDGTKRYVTEVIADNLGGVEFLDSKNSGNENNAADTSNNIDPDITPIDDNSDIPF